MPTRKVVNANEVFPAYIIRQLQQRLKGKGALVYIPALPTQDQVPSHLRLVAYFTEQGWSAARIAEQLKISPRQVYRLRKEMREHPERLAPKPPPVVKAFPPPAKPTTPRKPSRAQIERQQQQAEHARQQRIFGEEPLAPPTGSDIIEVPHVRFLPIERSDW